jgi:hypothetical protein
MSTITIPNLRKRAYILANNSIDAINSLNDVIYEGSPNKPGKLENKPEDLNNISLKYIQDGIDIYNIHIEEIKQKKDYLVSLQNKSQECMDVLKQIMESL